MSLNTKRIIIAILGVAFLISVLLAQYMETVRRAEEAGVVAHHVVVPANSEGCVTCHSNVNAGIIGHWKESKHARVGVGCVECHQAEESDPDSFKHYGALIAAVVTPRDCARCHPTENAEFAKSHHAKGGHILASLDNFLAETVEGARVNFNPHAPTPGRPGISMVTGSASVDAGCKQCHGSKVALVGSDGTRIDVDALKPGPDGKPTNKDAVAKIQKDADGRPRFDATTWPNTGIGRINLDGSLGSCTACHSRHDFSARRARQPENCGKCHLGPDHPQKEIYEESKHGVAFRDLIGKMNLDSESWVLGKDYSAAPTCATCHMSGNVRNGGKVTHDPGERISWTNRPPISLVMDTDKDHKVITDGSPEARADKLADGGDTWQKKRDRMKEVCSSCHTPDYVNNFYEQYDNLVVLYNEKFAKPGTAVMKALLDQDLRTKPDFDEEIEWTWFYLWHHEGRRARHGAAMMAPDYTHWHGMYEVAERFYIHFIPQAREILEHARKEGKAAQADAVEKVIADILAKPEHEWFEKAKAERAARKPSGG